MLRNLLVILALPLLAACGADDIYDPIENVQRAAYVHPGPAKLTLMTAINNRSGSGGHSGLLVSGSQRVVFDPAGSWWHPTAPERGDVHYGMTPTLLEFYVDYHARPSHHMVIQEIEVSPEIAERALRLVQENGSASKATCTQSISGILRELGFTEVRQVWFPDRLMRDFANVPGVAERKVFDDSPDPTSPGRPRVAEVRDDGLVLEPR